MKNARHWHNRYWQMGDGKIDINHLQDKSNWELLVEEIQRDAKGEPVPPIDSPIPVTNKEDAHILLQVNGVGANQVAWHKNHVLACQHATLIAKSLVGYMQRDTSIIITRPRTNIHL